MALEQSCDDLVAPDPGSGRDRSEVDLGLTWLLGVDRLIGFQKSQWNAAPVHLSRGDLGFYAPLMSAEDARAIANTALQLSQARVGRPFVEVLRKEHSVSRHNPQTPSELWQIFHEGGTILVQMAQRFHAPLARLCEAVERDLRAPVDATLICSPPGHIASKHFDRQDAIVVQVAGTKDWTLFPRQRVNPLSDVPTLPFETADAALLRLGRHRPEESKLACEQTKIRLEAGDLLYLPRGLYHEVRTADFFSFHVTLAVRTITYVDLFTAALARYAQTESALREALPLPGKGRDPDAIALIARSIAVGLAENLPTGEALHDLDTAFASSRNS
jgi:ribosomal protein L16 Arg81 hydroxylase